MAAPQRLCLLCWLAGFPKFPCVKPPARTDGYRDPRVSVTSLNLPPSLSLCRHLRDREEMTPRPAAIGELCVLLEGFPPRPLTSVLSVLTQHMKPGRRSAPGWCVEDLWGLLCYSERTHSWPCAKLWSRRSDSLMNTRPPLSVQYSYLWSTWMNVVHFSDRERWRC